MIIKGGPGRNSLGGETPCAQSHSDHEEQGGLGVWPQKAKSGNGRGPWARWYCYRRLVPRRMQPPPAHSSVEHTRACRKPHHPYAAGCARRTERPNLTGNCHIIKLEPGVVCDLSHNWRLIIIQTRGPIAACYFFLSASALARISSRP